MLVSNLIVDPLAEQGKPLKIRALSSIFHDMGTGSRLSGYCYYCEICEEMLALCPNLIAPGYVRWAFHDRCPSCHWKLESSLRCTCIRVPSRDLFQFHPMYKDPGSINSSVKTRWRKQKLLLISRLDEKTFLLYYTSILGCFGTTKLQLKIS